MKKKNDDLLFFRMMGEFLSVYLIKYRNFSKKTAIAYRQSLNQFRLFLQESRDMKVADFSFKYFTQENIHAFLSNLRDDKNASAATLNLRLSSIKSFLKYCGEQDMMLMPYYLDIQKVRDFKAEKLLSAKHLTEGQIKLLISQPDIGTRKGRRNRFIIIFMYETGLRIQELLDLKLSNIIELGDVTKVQVNGKGNKTRYIPILEPTMKFVKGYIDEFHNSGADNYLVYTIHDGKPTKMKQGALDSILKKCAESAHEKDNTFPLNIHAHMLRHSIGMAMYKNGVPISYIRDFLGHTSVSTTSIYSHADEEILRSALEKVAMPVGADKATDNIEKAWKGKEEYLLHLGGLL